ncbi:uncharacterized protein LOC105191978 [Harpegnathos saltator]|uniref:Uncharacterized protein n=1 Tax=Harpegnathos saltator TaxID=610380 RepID=E2B7P1_HARSA|nr:uncharacterized protein LOC105191978 [Harpegnathos saltator]EFN88319.1 hypothetical protein EAI_08814 [Harpegnathos saltator]
MWQCLWALFVVLACVSGEYLMGGHLDNNAGVKSRAEKINDNPPTLGRKRHVDDLDPDLVAEESTVGAVAVATASSALTDNDVPRYHIPFPLAFNGGKPFSLEKDPITGKIDFEKASPVRALNYTSRYHEYEKKESENTSKETDGEEDTYMEHGKIKDNEHDDVSPNEINTYTVNFHDFLNLPINYSSDKYGNNKYPLISSSYANTKVQSGSNSYSTYNHRPYHIESDSYTQPTRNPYASMTRTSTHRTTVINDYKAKPSTIIYPSPITLSTTKAPVVTTWKPSTTPSALNPINRTIAEKKNEENLLPTEQLQISSHVETYKNPNNVPTHETLKDETMEKTQTVNRYKNQPPHNNFVLYHAELEAKPSAQHEEYKDSYDIYESLDEGEGEGEVEIEGEGEANGDGKDSSDGDSEENDYIFQDSSRKHITSTPSTITVNAMLSTTTTNMATALLESTTSAATTIAPSGSSTQRMFQEDLASNSLRPSIMPQHPVISSSLSNDPGQSITERYDSNMSHAYKSAIKPGQDRVGAGMVVESTSNIVIPPDQDTVSFVLGNRQNVEGGYYSVGTAIGENPYGSLSDIETSFWPLRNNPYDPTKEIKHEQPPASVVAPSPDRIVQKWWPPGSGALKGSNELEPPRSQISFAATSIATTDTKNRHEEKDTDYITFPDVETKGKDATIKEHIVIVNEADDNMRELPPKATLTTTTTLKTTMTTMATNKTKINLPAVNASGDLPQLAENLMPPAEGSRPPPYYYHYQHDTLRTDHTRPQRLPPPSRVKPHSGFSGPPLDVNTRRRPYAPDVKLPNILPQFRPNAKASHGHRFGSDVIGTMSAAQSLPTRIRQPLQNHPSSRRPLPPPPLYLQRLNPPPPPIHAVRLAFVPTSKVDNVALPHETEPTIRKFRPPQVSLIARGGTEENAPPKSFDRVTDQDESESKTQDRSKSEIVDEREDDSSERYPEEPPMTPPRPPLFPKRRTADPLHVTTLQMIQHHGELANNDENNEDEAALTQPVEPVLAHQAERRKSDNHDSLEIAQQPVYVVYPVNSAVNIHPDDPEEKDDDGSVVVGTRGPHRPLPPDTLLQDEREKIYTVYNGRPVPVALDFPYPLEHPDPASMFPVAGTKETPLLVPSEQRQQQTAPIVASERENERDEQDATNVIPYLQDFLPFQKKNDAAISVTLHRTAPILTSASATATTLTSSSTPTSSPMSTSTVTSTPMPIAYVYTPAHAYPAHHLDDDADTAANIDSTATVLLPSQQPSSSSSSAPAPQNFMAPFVASISAEAPSKNGWNVVVVEPSLETDKSDGDNDDTKLASSDMDSHTEKSDFDVDNFKPQLFGGFKPIYEFPTEDVERRDETNIDADTSRHSKKLTVPDKR